MFLNAASTGPLPQRTVDAIARWSRLRANLPTLDDAEQFATLTRARQRCARLLNAEPREIALAVNTGSGINLAARALPLGKGDVVVGSDLEFPANVYPWMAAARERGFEYRRISARNGLLDEEALLAAIGERGVKCVAVSWVGFATGYRADLARLGEACRARGVFLVVDAIQGVGVAPIDVRRTPVDILACGGQKWLLAPWGSGFVYVRDALIETLQPPMVSWMSPRGTDDFSRLLDYDLAWRDDARRFEQITLPYQDIAGLDASLELFEELGHERISAHVARLADELVAWAVSRDDVVLVTPAERDRRAGIVAFQPRDGHAASERLRRARVVHSYREGLIRLAPHLYNTVDEVRAAVARI